MSGDPKTPNQLDGLDEVTSNTIMIGTNVTPVSGDDDIVTVGRCTVAQISALGGVALLSSNTSSNTTALTLDLTGYPSDITIKISSLKPVAVSTIQVQLSSDGNTYANTGYLYNAEGIAALLQDSIMIGGETGVNLYSYSSSIEILNRSSNTAYPSINFRGSRYNANGEIRSVYGVGGIANSQPINGIKIFCSNGNIASVRYSIWGYANT